MSIGYILAAFSCGVLACSMGACQSFVMAGLIGIAGMGVAAAMNGAALASSEVAAMLFPAVASGQTDVMTAVLGNMGPVISNIAFDAMFAPAIAFQAPIWAATYARKKGYIKRTQLCDTQCWVPLLEPFRRVDILLIGGLGGVFGALINWFITVYMNIAIDGHACAVLITCLLCKVIAGEDFISPIPQKLKNLGNRFSPVQEQGWLGHLGKASIRYTLAIFCGACFAYVEKILMLNPLTFGFAHVIGFLFGAVGLIFLMMNFQIQVLPPITASACFVVKGMVIAMGNTPEAVSQISDITFLIWGAAGGCIGITACHILIQTFKAFSSAYIDPPACAIVISSFLGFTIIAGNTAIACSIVVPTIIVALCIIYATIEYFIYKRDYNVISIKTST